MPHTTPDRERIWDLARSIGTCMFITHDGTRHRARPMAAHVAPEEHAIYFLTDADSAKAHQSERDASVTLAFADKGRNDYVTLSGPASVSNDRAKIRELWTAFAKAWWDSPDDPAIRLIRVVPDEAEYWDAPNGPVAAVRMLAAATTGGRPDLGEHAKLDL